MDMKFAVSLIATLTFMIAPVAPAPVGGAVDATPDFTICMWFKYLPLCPATR